MLRKKILDLIQSKREGSYWDFKEKPHDKNFKLIHDILSFSNSLYKGNKYLIIGVDDNGEIKGLTKETEHRKKLNDYIDFISKLPFAGDLRPEIDLHTFNFQNLDIDVLEIIDSNLKPFYLTKKIKNNGGLIPYHIYTRVMDKNTSIESSADIYYLEKMWKQRFNIDVTPIERIKNLLSKPTEWNLDLSNKNYSYHKHFPEFNIEFSEASKNIEPYRFFYSNELSDSGTVFFKYHSTILFELRFIICDGGLEYLPEPKKGNIMINDSNKKSSLFYYYFDLLSSDNRGVFLNFLTKNGKNFHSSRNGAFPFIPYSNIKEKERFESFVQNNYEAFMDKEVPSEAKHAAKMRESIDKSLPLIDLERIGKLLEFHKEWKEND